ncbi:hypothetical protein EOL99_04445 [Candidatus Falkowbacteria bacterium]|nr:hypothetical protein [Candidatus Falkowbacteria bacterium]
MKRVEFFETYCNWTESQSTEIDNLLKWLDELEIPFEQIHNNLTYFNGKKLSIDWKEWKATILDRLSDYLKTALSEDLGAFIVDYIPDEKNFTKVFEQMEKLIDSLKVEKFIGLTVLEIFYELYEGL